MTHPSPQAAILIGDSDQYARVSRAFHDIRGAPDVDASVRVLRICAWATHVPCMHAACYRSTCDAQSNRSFTPSSPLIMYLHITSSSLMADYMGRCVRVLIMMLHVKAIVETLVAVCVFFGKDTC
jgi:hypothetical protein